MNFRSLYPSTSKALLEITSNPNGAKSDCPTGNFCWRHGDAQLGSEPAGQLGSRRLS